MFCLQQITRPSQEDKSDEKNEEDKSEKSEKKEDEEKKDEEEKDEKEDSRWAVKICLCWCHVNPLIHVDKVPLPLLGVSPFSQMVNVSPCL